MKRCFVLAAVLSLTALAAGSPASGAMGAACSPTIVDGGGPFGQGEPPVRAKIGKGLVLTGVVLDTNCRPIPRARVQFWQSSKDGVYRPSGSATVITNKAGRFRFQCPFPPQYEGLPPHIHIRVDAADFEELVTRYVPAAGSHRGTIRLVLVPPDL
ncbi:MAG: dioxygenase family protein [Gaiellaceae bacterium]